jgi:hypothetical protein
MTVRTTVNNVTFIQPFQLPDMDCAYPPGSYLVETDEEPLHGISFLAYRRVATRIHLTKPGLTEVLTIDPKDLDLAKARDEPVGQAPPMTTPLILKGAHPQGRFGAVDRNETLLS